MLYLKNFKVIHFKKKDYTTLRMSGSIDLPALDLSEDTVESRITLEMFRILPDGSDLVITNENIFKIENYRNVFVIKK